MHHLIFDGHSLELVLDTVAAAFNTELPPEMPAFMDHRTWIEQERLSDPFMAREFWTKYMAPVKSVDCWSGTRAPPMATSFNARSAMHLSESDVTKLFDFAAEHGLTLVRLTVSTVLC